jgi:hypothetical protein
VGDRVGASVRVGEGSAVIVGVTVTVAEAVNVPSGVSVGLLIFVGVDDGGDVVVGRSVATVGVTGRAVAANKRFATGSPNKAEATVDVKKTSASRSHCHPTSI